MVRGDKITEKTVCLNYTNVNNCRNMFHLYDSRRIKHSYVSMPDTHFKIICKCYPGHRFV